MNATTSRVPKGRSEVSGDTDAPLLDRTVAGMLAETAARSPDREAAVFLTPEVGGGEGAADDTGGGEGGAGVERWTYAELAAKVDALAHGLRRLGLGSGDRVGIWSPNRPEWLLAQFATARLGCILVNVNPAYRTGELEYALHRVGCRALITASSFKSSDYLAMLRELAPDMVESVAGDLHLERLPELRAVIQVGSVASPGTLAFDDVLASGAPALPGNEASVLDEIAAGLSPDDPINIQFTSGTTGLPKGATLTHRNIVNNAFFVTGAMRLTQDDRLCIPVPFYHCFGMVMGTLGCVTRGATMVIPGEGFDPVATLHAVEAERCTALYGVPTMFVAMLDHDSFDGRDLTSLRTGIMAGSPCPVEVMKRVQRDMHMDEVTIAYGMTETSPVSFQSSTDDPLDKRTGSVGRVHPHVEVRIVDESGAPVPVGAQGELLTRGYSVMAGYWDDDERTAGAIDGEGWMHTGDLATLDAEGYCNITGRVKDMICRGGENVYPREVEEYLYGMPGLAQVQVFGVPDERLGEIVCAWVVPRAGSELTEDGVRDWCRERIAHYKVPTVVRVVDELPMTVTGKAQKFLMREAMVSELGLVEAETA